MRSDSVSNYIFKLQSEKYEKLNQTSCTCKSFGRKITLETALFDVGLETIKPVLVAIESLAFAAVNLFGFAFKTTCKLGDAIYHGEKTLSNIINTPISLLLAPIKLIYQIAVIYKDPLTAKSIHNVSSNLVIIKLKCY